MPMKVSYVNLTNRSAAFQDWLVRGQPVGRQPVHQSPKCGVDHVVDEFLEWRTSFWERVLQSSWGGWLGQTVAERLTQDPSRFHPETGAWMVREDVPLVQHQRHLVQVHIAPRVRRALRWSPHVRIQAGWAGWGPTQCRCLWNTRSCQEEPMASEVGASGSWGRAT